MLKIGITGGIGSGKSLVCKVFISLGIPVYNADERAKYLIENNLEIREQIIAIFGSEAFRNQLYNRKYIADKVFNDKNLLTKLNEIVHPKVGIDFYEWTLHNKDSIYLVEEAALLFESGAYKKMDYNILVDAPVETRIERVMLRDHLSHEEIQSRINNQVSTDKIRHLVDWIIINNNKQLILPQILQIHNYLIEQNKK